MLTDLQENTLRSMLIRKFPEDAVWISKTMDSIKTNEKVVYIYNYKWQK